MKKLFSLLFVAVLLWSCGASKTATKDPVLFTIAGKPYQNLVVVGDDQEDTTNLIRLELETFDKTGIKGIVIDARNGKPLAAAAVQVQTAMGPFNATTDSNGFFLNTFKGNIDIIRVTHPDYADLVISMQDYELE